MGQEIRVGAPCRREIGFVPKTEPIMSFTLNKARLCSAKKDRDSGSGASRNPAKARLFINDPIPCFPRYEMAMQARTPRHPLPRGRGGQRKKLTLPPPSGRGGGGEGFTAPISMSGRVPKAHVVCREIRAPLGRPNWLCSQNRKARLCSVRNIDSRGPRLAWVLANPGTLLFINDLFPLPRNRAPVWRPQIGFVPKTEPIMSFAINKVRLCSAKKQGIRESGFGGFAEKDGGSGLAKGRKAGVLLRDSPAPSPPLRTPTPTTRIPSSANAEPRLPNPVFLPLPCTLPLPPAA